MVFNSAVANVSRGFTLHINKAEIC